MPGPPPKRSENRRRENKPVREIVKPAGAAPSAPELGIPGCHVLAAEWYASLEGSVEARFFTPAVWQRARINAKVLSDFLSSSKPSSMLYAAIQSDWRSLLVDPGEQRRLQIEVQAAVSDPDADHADATVLSIVGQLGG